MSKNTDNKDLAQSNDKSSGNESKRALIKDTQIHQAKEDHAESFESFGHSFNKLIATVTGEKIESVADKLSPEMAERLYHGKMLDQQLQDHKGMRLSVDEHQSLDDYRKFKDTITRQIPLFDHDALVETLNARIAERVSQNKPIIEAPVSNSKLPHADAPSFHKTQQIEKQQTKVDSSTPAEKKHAPSFSQTEKTVPVSPAPQVGHLAKQNETKVSDARQTGQERSRLPAAQVAGTQAAHFGGPKHSEEIRPVSAKAERLPSDNRAISGGNQLVESHKIPHSHGENLGSVPHLSKKGQILTAHEQRENSKNPTESKSISQSLTLQFQGKHTLSEKTLNTLNQREFSVQRTLSLQNEKSPEKFSPINSLKSEIVITRHAVQSLSENLSKNIKFEPGAAINSSHSPLESGVIKRHLGAPEKSESTSSSKSEPDSKLGAKIENHVLTPGSFHTDKQIITSVKTTNEFPRPASETSLRRIENFSALEKQITPIRTNVRVELSSILSLKVDAHRRLNLPVSNVLTRTPEVDRVKKNDAAARFEARVIAAAKRSPVSEQPVRRSTNNEKAPQSQAKEFVVVKGKIGQRRYILGAEIALAAVIASAGIARVRHDRVIPQDLGNQNTLTTNPALESNQSAHRDGPEVLEVARKYRPAAKAKSLGRRIDDDIESFAVSSDLLREIKANEKQFLQDVQKFFKQILGNNNAHYTIKTEPLFRPTILVEIDDTLQKIAERYFNDINVAWLIADLNRGNVQEAYIDLRRIISMQSRQTLILPVWTDIVDFYQNDFAHIEIERLVTIIETAQVDIELYSKTFANVIENKSTRKQTNDVAVSEAQTEA
ncbi:MAG: hypothetical protein P4L53_00720 [Candidatus Obscuribacterales bacterium]|nr:hypothetical protein [Candidatus Obscuribacterales bacterium]